MNVLIEPSTARRLWAFIRAADTEIGGWGYARLQGPDLLWEQVFLVPQEVSASEVDFEATGGDAVAVERAIKDRVLEDPAFVWVSWHSHHTMKPYWSGTDEDRIAALARTGIRRLLSFVGCHNRDYRLRLDLFGVEAHGVSIPQVSLGQLTLTSADGEFAASITQEIAANVSQIPARQTCGRSSPSKSGGQKMLPWPEDEDDERTLGVAEAFAVKDLIEHDFTYYEARRALDEIGVEEVEELIDSGELPGPDEFLAQGGPK